MKSELTEAELKQWVLSQREIVTQYLVSQKVTHGEIGAWPACEIAPHVAIWAIESFASPGDVGWWVISGDLPTDYISSSETRHPRGAVRIFAENWRKLSGAMAKKRSLMSYFIASGSKRVDDPQLAPLLLARSQFLSLFASDDEFWDYDEAEYEGS